MVSLTVDMPTKHWQCSFHLKWGPLPHTVQGAFSNFKSFNDEKIFCTVFNFTFSHGAIPILPLLKQNKQFKKQLLKSEVEKCIVTTQEMGQFFLYMWCSQDSTDNMLTRENPHMWTLRSCKCTCEWESLRLSLCTVHLSAF